MSPSPGGGSPPQYPRFVVKCTVCGRVRDCTPAEVSLYLAAGWPTCCGEVMTLTPKSDLPGPGDPPRDDAGT